MKSTVVIGKGVYALSLAKVIELFLPTSHLPFSVLAGSERLEIKNHLATLQRTNSVVLCCSSDTKPSAVASWIRTLRDACVRAELLILVQGFVLARSLRNVPLFCDRRGAFKMDNVPGLKILAQDISLGTLVVFCHLAHKSPDVCWQRLVSISALQRARQLYSICDQLYLRTGSMQEAGHSLQELAVILVGEDLIWESILELDLHYPMFPENFMRARSRLSLAVSRSDADIKEMWDATRDLFTFTKGEEAEA